MRIQLMDPLTVENRLQSGDFEACLHVYRTHADALRKNFGSGSLLGYRNSEASDIIDKALATADPGEQGRQYAALTKIFLADMPATRLMPWTATDFVHRRVRGLRSPFHAHPDTYIEDLWLEDGSQQ